MSLDKSLDEILMYLQSDARRTDSRKARAHQRQKAKTALKKLINEAKIEELERIPKEQYTAWLKGAMPTRISILKEDGAMLK